MFQIMTSFVPRKTKSIDDIRVGGAFMRANLASPKESIISDPSKCFIYIRLPNSNRSLGNLCDVPDTKRIGYCLQGKTCTYIDRNEPLYEVDLKIEAEVLL